MVGVQRWIRLGIKDDNNYEYQRERNETSWEQSLEQMNGKEQIFSGSLICVRYCVFE